MNKSRDQWVSKLGLVLAMAGNAVGLGNFLRFPTQAAGNGGGAFMIPYIIAFLLLGLPLMLVEWAMGRYGGSKGHATMPGIFGIIGKSKLFRWFGVLGVWIPLFIASYYAFIESWTLGYAIFSFTAPWGDAPTQASLSKFFTEYTTFTKGGMGIFITSYILFLFTITINSVILYKGVSQGIEKVAKVMMPILFIFAVILMIRVMTLGTPNPSFSIGEIRDWDTVTKKLSSGETPVLAALWNSMDQHSKDAVLNNNWKDKNIADDHKYVFVTGLNQVLAQKDFYQPRFSEGLELDDTWKELV